MQDRSVVFPCTDPESALVSSDVHVGQTGHQFLPDPTLANNSSQSRAGGTPAARNLTAMIFPA